jgi:hypothetical protein
MCRQSTKWTQLTMEQPHFKAKMMMREVPFASTAGVVV